MVMIVDQAVYIGCEEVIHFIPSDGQTVVQTIPRSSQFMQGDINKC